MTAISNMNNGNQQYKWHWINNMKSAIRMTAIQRTVNSNTYKGRRSAIRRTAISDTKMWSVMQLTGIADTNNSDHQYIMTLIQMTTINNSVIRSEYKLKTFINNANDIELQWNLMTLIRMQNTIIIDLNTNEWHWSN